MFRLVFRAFHGGLDNLGPARVWKQTTNLSIAGNTPFYELNDDTGACKPATSPDPATILVELAGVPVPPDAVGGIFIS